MQHLLTRRAVGIALSTSLLVSLPTHAFDPITGAISKGIATAMDARSSDEVKADVEIDAALSKKLLDQPGDDLKNVSLLVFARHAVLVGYAKSESAKGKAAGLVTGHKLVRSLKNDIVVGPAPGSLSGNLVLDKKIDLTLTATKGVSSVNMRWKVYGGNVFLMGVAQNKTEADLAVKTIKGLDGVKTVRSSLRIGKK